MEGGDKNIEKQKSKVAREKRPDIFLCKVERKADESRRKWRKIRGRIVRSERKLLKEREKDED